MCASVLLFDVILQSRSDAGGQVYDTLLELYLRSEDIDKCQCGTSHVVAHRPANYEVKRLRQKKTIELLKNPNAHVSAWLCE